MAALRSYAKRARDYDDMVINLKVKGKERRLPSQIEMLVYRVIQEALNNVWKHAKATVIQLDISFEDRQINVSVADNGKGFRMSETLHSKPHSGKLGIIGMQERARLLNGQLEFESSPGKGTVVRLTVPC